MKKNGPVRLGLLAPLSGLVSMYGVEISNAAHIACAEVNRAGGVLGRPLKLIVEDDGSVAESAVLAAEKLIKKSHCVSLIGNLLSNARISVTHQVAEPLRVPLLNFSFYEGSIFSPYFFHFAALPNQQIDKMMPFMRKQFGPKMFFAGNNYEWPRGSIDASKQALLACGGTISGEEYYPLGLPESDLETLINRLSISEADVFVPYFAGADQVRVLKKFTEKGLKPKMAVVMGHFDEIMMSHLSASVRGGFFSSNTYFMSVDTPENKKFLKQLSKLPKITGVWPKGNGILTNFGEGTYLCVKAFAKAANQAGTLDPNGLIDALEEISVRGPQGSVKMDPVMHHLTITHKLWRSKDFPVICYVTESLPASPDRGNSRPPIALSS